MPAEPMQFFDSWFDQAVKANVQEPNAMQLATVSPHGFPEVRVVYLRNFDQAGLVFFTNYNSHKGAAIAANPRAGVNFFWAELSRQVKFSGEVKKVAAEVSDAYFASRPRASQIGAWASNQSRHLDDRDALEDRVKEFEAKFEGREVPRPDYWGGYVLSPVLVEFWQGRPSRLHDRIVYKKSGSGMWNLERIAP